MEKSPSYWLEPTERFVNSLFEATLTVSGTDALEKLKLLKKTGSNLKIQDRKIQVEFRDAWKTIEKHSRIAHLHTAPHHRGAAFVGKSGDVSHLAEEVRFELTRPLRAYRFSRPAHSAALPLLRDSFQDDSRGGKISQNGRGIRWWRWRWRGPWHQADWRKVSAWFQPPKSSSAIASQAAVSAEPAPGSSQRSKRTRSTS
jgi:hypothetical protein